MNILVVSDTHGDIARALDAFETYNPFCRFDMIIHCGDTVPDAKKLEVLTGCEVVSVPGNCDGVRTRTYEIVETTAGRILVTHGHTEGVKMDLMRLFLLAREEHCVAACFGHTHIPCVQKIAEITLINPGSTSRPRGGSEPSCAIIAIKNDILTARTMKI